MLIFNYIGGPDIFLLIALTCIVLLGFVLLISTLWKISGHAAAAGGLLVVAFNYYDNLVYLLGIIAALIIWSRIKLGCHTFTQTAVGFLLGIASFSFFLVTFG